MDPVTLTAVPLDSAAVGDAIRVREACRSPYRTDADTLRVHLDGDPGSIVVLARDAAGAPVATGELGPIRSRDEPHGRWLGMWTLPHLRGRGLGRRVWDALDAHSTAHGLALLRTGVSADEPDAVAFLARRGFREVERDQFVSLDLSGGPPPAVAVPAGLRIVSVAERPDLVDLLPGAEREILPDIPGDDPSQLHVAGADEWRRRLAAGTYRPWAVLAALDGGAVAGLAYLEFDGPGDSAWHDLTGVRPAWRGRGVARALKGALAARAAAEGVRTLLATNHLDNAAMRAVNARMGYVRGPDRIGMRQDRRAPG